MCSPSRERSIMMSRILSGTILLASLGLVLGLVADSYSDETPPLTAPAWDAGCAAPTTTLEKTGPADSAKPRRLLRISADPNNLPFTNEKQEGFENKIAG